MNGPKIKLDLNSTDKMLEIAGVLMLVALWLFVVVNYFNLPNTIPIHFNGSGMANGFGVRASIFALPLIATLLYIGMTLLNKYPHTFNYPIRITVENAIRQYTNATQMIRVFKFIIVVIISLISINIIQSALGKLPEGLGDWFLPMILSLIFIPLVYFLVKSISLK